MKKLYDLAVKTSSYTDKSGNEKGKYANVGSIMQKDDGGKFILMNRTFNPAGVPNPDNRDSIIVSMFEPKKHDEKTDPIKNGERVDLPDNPFNDDDIPY